MNLPKSRSELRSRQIYNEEPTCAHAPYNCIYHRDNIHWCDFCVNHFRNVQTIPPVVVLNVPYIPGRYQYEQQLIARNPVIINPRMQPFVANRYIPPISISAPQNSTCCFCPNNSSTQN